MSASARRRSRAARRPKAPPLRAATPEALLQAAFEIGRYSALDVGAIDLGAEFLRALSTLLPGRSIALRLADPRSLALRAMESVGMLRPGVHRLPLGVKPSAIRRMRLPESITATGRVEAHARYQPIFVDTSSGFAVPIAAGGELHGLVNVELPGAARGGAELLAADEAVVIPLANQLAVALRNVELLAEAQRTHERIEQIVARANTCIAVVRRDGSLALANDAYLRFVGLLREEVPAVSVERWMARHPVVPEPRLGVLVLRAIAGEEIDTIDAYAARTDGVVVRAAWSLTPLRDGRGIVDSVIIVGHDLERIRSLERQVVQSEKLATLGQLAAGVAHELNNPLTSIGVYAEYLAKKLERIDPGEVDKARKILDGAERIRKLTQDLVSYARPAGERAPVDVNSVVAQALSFCEHVLGQVEARLEAFYAPSLPRVLGLKGQLQQVVINLITNACHAVDRKGGQVGVTTGRAVDGRVTIQVRDDGPGIPAHQHARLFEPFFTTKSEGKGTGLGLSIVKNIVEGHGGTVAFESAPGAGTTFTVALPAAAEPDR